MNFNKRKLLVFPLGQPIGNFYTTTMKSDELYSLSKADIMRIAEDEIDGLLYDGVQRELNQKKVKKIVKYLSQPDATFPNSIILNLNMNYFIKSYEENEKNYIEFIKDENTFSIIDGQHRLEGLKEANLNIDVPVSIYTNLRIDQQQEIFTRINSEQTKINPSVTIYQESTGKYNTPRKFAAKIAISFGVDRKSVWNQKIKIVGKKDMYSKNGVISLKSFYEPILDFIYNDDDYYIVREKIIESNNRPKLIDINYTKEKYIFWEFYVKGDSASVYKILNNFFDACKLIFPKEWEEKNKESILQKTTGYYALMSVFKKLYVKGISEGDLSLKYFENMMSPLNNLDGKINAKNYSSSGLQSSKKLYDEFAKWIFPDSELKEDFFD
ncbi:DGQHR domain-containing protein [Candidatus Enterococcus mansonii]|uniref:DGQHR domain-containing protein n=1 Tax=Candidatus Enterococcus mansonii TaxID=1834181 RepID=A0A242CF22_9ENTE|nr:DGQHR domain-containing protein [Enterococcus sp. 4G2_DIV0659]OTO08811.1 hypothetical protein A5880_001811 [Enterococcus sp. 4G2_DIV0659]